MVEQSANRTDASLGANGITYLSWPAIIAGAIAAAGLAFVLETFGAAIGLAIASPSATWRDASVALAFLSGLWILLTALASFGLGGYLAGRLRARWSTTGAEEREFRDGIHGFLVWALAVLLAGLLALTAARSISPAAATATASSASSVEPLLAFEVDRLFRSDRRAGEALEPDLRSQATRIIATSLGHKDMAADDRAFLSRIVAARTGLAQPDADRRVNDVIAAARQAVRRARASGVILAFMTAASLLAGAAAAWFAAGLGGRHRDADTVPNFWTSSSLAMPAARLP
jgi:hypothetical protein